MHRETAPRGFHSKHPDPRHPYVDGSQGSHTSTGSGYFIGGHSVLPNEWRSVSRQRHHHGEWLLQWDVIRIIHRQGQCETAPQRVEDRWLPPGIQRSLHRLQDHPGVEIHPCMEETAKAERVRDTGIALTNGGGDARNGINNGGR